MEKQSVQVRIPAWGRKIEAIAADYKLDSDRMKLVLHQFFLAYLKNNIGRMKCKSGNFHGYHFPVSSRLLTRAGTNRYSRYVEVLIQEGFIRRKHSELTERCYMVGGHAQLYEWSFPAEQDRPRFKKEILKSYKPVKAALLARDKFAIKIVPANAAEDNTFNLLLSYVQQVVVQPHDIPDREDRLRVLMTEARLNGDMKWFKRDSFGRRLHHQFTSLPKEYRCYLRFDGHIDEPLAEVDIRNSQPYFFSIMNNPILIARFMPEFEPVLPLFESFKDKGAFRLFQQHCIDGTLYGFLGAAMAENDADKIKKGLFKAVLFSKRRVYGKDLKFRKRFELHYPEVASLVAKVKSLEKDSLPELIDIMEPINKSGDKFSNNSYKLVACMLQRLESAIMYQVIVPALVQVGIGPMLTIHDSVMVLASKKAQAGEIIKACFVGLGVKPPALK